jgi:hypothetical protein
MNTPLPFVTQSMSGFWVVNAKIGPFRTHAEAWRWVDQHTDAGRDDQDRYDRIRIAFSKCGASPAPDVFRHYERLKR